MLISKPLGMKYHLVLDLDLDSDHVHMEAAGHTPVPVKSDSSSHVSCNLGRSIFTVPLQFVLGHCGESKNLLVQWAIK